eukprot:m.1656233 g.1656233  ORF g.1656233 m.1656233 type:complete len:62 (+) comp106866_c0_seq1:212-397(+)
MGRTRLYIASCAVWCFVQNQRVASCVPKTVDTNRGCSHYFSTGLRKLETMRSWCWEHDDFG